MIVMGTHGFGTFRSLLLGSVSNFVMQNADCPVLLCKGMPDDWDDDEHYIAVK
jgi:nucleotide-binding universal stress UspA family protein